MSIRWCKVSLGVMTLRYFPEFRVVSSFCYVELELFEYRNENALFDILSRLTSINYGKKIIVPVFSVFT